MSDKQYTVITESDNEFTEHLSIKVDGKDIYLRQGLPGSSPDLVLLNAQEFTEIVKHYLAHVSQDDASILYQQLAQFVLNQGVL